MAEATFQTLTSRYLYRLDPGATLSEIWRLLSNPETADAALIAEALQGNQAFEHLLRTSDLIKKRAASAMEEEEADASSPGLDSKKVVAFLGKSATRNALTCIRLMRQTGEGLPKKEGESLTLDPPKLLRFALAAEEFCIDHRIAGSESAFLGGLLFDWIRALAVSEKTTPKPSIAYLEECWKEAFRAAQIAHHVGAALKTFKYHEYAFPAAIAPFVGQGMMGILHLSSPNWGEFDGPRQKEGWHPTHIPALIREQKTYPLTHFEVAALIVSFFPPIRAVEKAVCHIAQPYFLKHVHPDLFRLSVILGISTHLARLPKEARLKTNLETALSPHQLRWLREIEIKLDSVKKALAHVEDAGK